MQLFVDNWSASLLAPATASAVSLTVEPAKAALLTGLGSGNFYRLTLVEVDAAGTEIDWDVVQVTAVAGGALTVIRTDTARDWPAGTLIEARLTAAGLAEKQDRLVSGETLKTVNGLSLLGSGDLSVLPGGDGSAPAPVILDYPLAAVPVPAAVGQLMTCFTSVWIAVNTSSAWGWKRVGPPPAYGLAAQATAQGSAPANATVAGSRVGIYVGPVPAGATVHNSIRLPVLPQGVSLLDPMFIDVVDLSGKSASHALRLYDDDYTATYIDLTCHDGINVQAVRQAGYVELTAMEDVRYEIIGGHYDDGASVEIDAVRRSVRVSTGGLGSAEG